MSRRAAPSPPRVAPADRELMLPVPGGRLYVRVNGDPNGPRPPLLMVHGGPGGSHYSSVRALPLADQRAVILYDQLGCGRSAGGDDAEDWTIDRFVAEIAAVRAALGLERVHLLGHSWGATLALEHAAAGAAGLASLILSSPLVSTAAWMADAATLRAMLPAEVQRMLDACERGAPPPEAECEAANKAFEARFYMRRRRAPEVAAYRDAMPRWFSPALYRALWGPTEFRCTGSLRDYDGTALLPRLAATPTLFLTGEHDEAVPATVARFAAASQGRFVEVPDAGHSTLNDNQPFMLATLRRWLAEHDA